MMPKKLFIADYESSVDFGFVEVGFRIQYILTMLHFVIEFSALNDCMNFVSLKKIGFYLKNGCIELVANIAKKNVHYIQLRLKKL